MFLHNKKMMYTVRVDQPNPRFAKMLLEQFGGPNGELGAALRYFGQGWAESDAKRRDLLLNIATEELSHLEMVGQMLTMLLKGSPGALVDQVEAGYLGDLLDQKHDHYTEMALNSSQTVLGGPGPLDGELVHDRLGRHDRKSHRRPALRHCGRGKSQDRLRAFDQTER
jgi:Mn-containing catalase